MDVVTAIEGSQEAFRCTEIRKQGVGAGFPATSFVGPCAISGSMRRAELAWRRELAGSTIADVRDEVDAKSPNAAAITRRAYGRIPVD